MEWTVSNYLQINIPLPGKRIRGLVREPSKRLRVQCDAPITRLPRLDDVVRVMDRWSFFLNCHVLYQGYHSGLITLDLSTWSVGAEEILRRSWWPEDQNPDCTQSWTLQKRGGWNEILFTWSFWPQHEELQDWVSSTDSGEGGAVESMVVAASSHTSTSWPFLSLIHSIPVLLLDMLVISDLRVSGRFNLILTVIWLQNSVSEFRQM